MENEAGKEKSGERLSAQVEALWTRLLPRTKERLAELERVAAAMSQGLVEAKMVSAAAVISHQMAGSLGTFGLPSGTRIARELELELEMEQPEAEKVVRLTRELRTVVDRKG